jgi:hypothetical protein
MPFRLGSAGLTVYCARWYRCIRHCQASTDGFAERQGRTEQSNGLRRSGPNGSTPHGLEYSARSADGAAIRAGEREAEVQKIYGYGTSLHSIRRASLYPPIRI